MNTIYGIDHLKDLDPSVSSQIENLQKHNVMAQNLRDRMEDRADSDEALRFLGFVDALLDVYDTTFDQWKKLALMLGAAAKKENS